MCFDSITGIHTQILGPDAQLALAGRGDHEEALAVLGGVAGDVKDQVQAVRGGTVETQKRLEVVLRSSTSFQLPLSICDYHTESITTTLVIHPNPD